MLISRYFFIPGVALTRYIIDAFQRADVKDQDIAGKMYGYMTASKSDNTVKKYFSSFKG